MVRQRSAKPLFIGSIPIAASNSSRKSIICGYLRSRRFLVWVVRERKLKFQIAAPISVDEFWELRSATSSTLRMKLASFPDAQVRQVAEDVKEDVRGFFPNGQMSFPAQIIIVSGQKS